MRAIFPVIASLLFAVCTSSAQEKVVTKKVADENKLNALNFARQQFEGCKSGKFVTLTTEIATPYLVKSLTDDDMKGACEKINESCGELIDLKLTEILSEKRGYIYRFKARYSNTTCKPEIRVYNNLNHKFDGLIYKPEWQDKYTPYTGK